MPTVPAVPALVQHCRRPLASRFDRSKSTTMEQLAMTGEMIERFRGYLLLLARSHIDPRRHTKLEASDLVQQTMLAGFEKRGQFRGNCEAELAQWLKQILVHQLADAVRAEVRDKRNIACERSLE